nr:hypothetical protein [Deltaproteobacteria bacterium]
MRALRLCITALVATGFAATPAVAQTYYPDEDPEPFLDPGEGYDPAPIESVDPYDTLQPGDPPSYAPTDDPSYSDESLYDQGYTDPGYGDPNAAIGTINDEVIASTLSPYGTWIQDPQYGRVWRPDPQYVGTDFTPYESCGQWTYTEYGWTFNCDEWDWGWLPFHYGQWDWFEPGYWGWVPDYTWSPAWVDWRSGNDYIGWRPARPLRSIRRGPIYRDHDRDRHWIFTRREHFHGARIRPYAVRNREPLRYTAPVTAPPIRGERRVNVRSIMQGRWRGSRGPGVRQPDLRGRGRDWRRDVQPDRRGLDRTTRPQLDRRGLDRTPDVQ